MQASRISLVFLIVGACTKDQPPVGARQRAAQPPEPTVAAPAPGAMGAPGGMDPHGGGMGGMDPHGGGMGGMDPHGGTSPHGGMAGAATPAPKGDELSGTVLETMNSGGYTYAKLDRGGSQVWLAGPETPLAVGAKISGASGGLMSNFRSDTLNRTFDQIYFVSSFAGAPAVAPHGAPAGAVAAVEKIEPAAGGTTIAKIFADKATLATKPVVVRGKVTKVNNGILGRNWLHLQDGTGGVGSNDLVVTTTATVAKDDVVVVRGTVATNKDFGAGYTYAVMIEDATIAAK